MSLQEKVSKPEYAVSAAYIVFLALAYLSYRIPLTSKYLLRSFSTPPSLLAYALSLLGLAVLVLSVRLGNRIEIKNKKPILIGILITTSMVVYITLNIPLILAALMGGGYAILLFYLSSQEDFKRLTKLVFAMAVFSALSILVQGIPILSASAREATAISTSRALFHGFGVFSGALLVGFYDKQKALIAVIVLAVAGLLSGFKSDAIAIILSASITGLLLNKISMRSSLPSSPTACGTSHPIYIPSIVSDSLSRFSQEWLTYRCPLEP
jgi:hypothetical protein